MGNIPLRQVLQHAAIAQSAIAKHSALQNANATNATADIYYAEISVMLYQAVCN